MFGTVLDKIQALFSRSFLLGNFFPVSIFAGVNVAIAAAGIRGASHFLATSLFPDGGPSAVTTVTILVTIAVFAYILAPMVPLFRSALDGKFLCPSLFEVLRKRHIERVKHLLTQRDAVARRLEEDERKIEEARPRLANARRYGNANPNAINRNALDRAEQALAELREDVLKKSTYEAAGRFPDDRLVINALSTVESALHSNPSDLPSTDRNYGLARLVDGLQTPLISELQRLCKVASRWIQTADFELVSSFDVSDIKPTRVGNSRAALERYPAVAYSADFDFLWPRLRMVLGDSKDLSAALDDATAQLDFAVLMTILSTVTVVVWIPVLAAFGTSIWVFVAVGLLGPPSIVFFYLLVDETQKAFGATVIMVIDATRLKLLTALHQPLPSSSAAEKETWRLMQTALYTEEGPSMRYRHAVAK
jgi:hypothetical protein